MAEEVGAAVEIEVSVRAEPAVVGEFGLSDDGDGGDQHSYPSSHVPHLQPCRC